MKLGTIHIFKSGNRQSYRAVSATKTPLKHMVTVLRFTPLLDLAFLKWTMIRRCATIRVSPKQSENIHHVETLTSRMPYCYSLPHSIILNKLWDIPIPKKNDGLSQITWVNYETVMKEPQREIRNVQQSG